jgi:MraZ protein
VADQRENSAVTPLQWGKVGDCGVWWLKCLGEWEPLRTGGELVFLGTYTPKLDDKGRLTLPAKFRDALAGGLMVTKSQDHSLAVYPRAEFEQLARRASKTSRSNPEARAFLRNLAAGTDEQHPDAQGRITLSADHRRYASLSKDCVVIGAVDFLEIWDAQAWQDYQQTHEENFSAASDEALGDII